MTNKNKKLTQEKINEAEIAIFDFVIRVSKAERDNDGEKAILPRMTEIAFKLQRLID